jgi:hypothetical protein
MGNFRNQPEDVGACQQRETLYNVQINKLRNAKSELTATLEELYSRLSPVLGIVPPAPTGLAGAEKATESFESPVLQDINGMITTTARQIAMVHEMINRLDI